MERKTNKWVYIHIAAEVVLCVIAIYFGVTMGRNAVLHTIWGKSLIIILAIDFIGGVLFLAFELIKEMFSQSPS